MLGYKKVKEVNIIFLEELENYFLYLKFNEFIFYIKVDCGDC